MDRVPTPSQTAGPFFHLGLTSARSVAQIARPEAKGERVRLVCRVFDGEGKPVPDAMLEIWQADAGGRYNHPDDLQEGAADPHCCGFGRLATDETGSCVFETIKPGRVPASGGGFQAPHLSVSVLARGILLRLATRIYFDGEPSNSGDPVLALVPAERRGTLMAKADAAHPGSWVFDIHLCGEAETVFFDV